MGIISYRNSSRFGVTSTLKLGEITSWVGKTANQSNCDWVGAHLEDNRDSCGRRFCCERCRSASRRYYHSHMTTYQICRQLSQSTVLTFRPTIFNCDISALGISGFAETLSEGSQTAGKEGRRFSAKISVAPPRRVINSRRRMYPLRIRLVRCLKPSTLQHRSHVCPLSD